MKTKNVIKDLEELLLFRRVPDEYRQAVKQAVEILKRLAPPQIVTPNFPPVSLEDESA